MTVSSESYTTNSIKITVSNETTSANIISAVDTAITTLGWTQYDYIAAGASTQINGVANTYSPISTYVYRALCADNTYYKYLIIRWDTVKTMFYTSAAEGWTLATHTPVNETWNSTGLFPHGYDLKDCYILVSASRYHFMIWPWIRSTSGMWSAIMEFERVVAEDNTGVPCFAWTNSLMIGTPYGYGVLTTKSTTMFAFPRTADGNTGAAAANVYAPVTNRGMFPPTYPQGGLGTFTDANNNALHLGSYYNMTYGWDSTKTTVSPLSADAITKSMPFGRAFNWGVSKPLGSGLDTTTVPGSSTGGWPDGNGTNTDYLILGMSGGPDNTTVTTGAYNLNLSGRPTQLGYGTSTAQLYKPILIGITAWIAAGDGIRTYDTTNTAAGAATTLRYSNAEGVYDLVFDGLRTIYGSTSTGLVRIDTETFNTGTVTLTNGSSYLSIDQLYVYAVSRTSSTTPNCYVVSRWSTSDGSTGTGFALVSTFTSGTATYLATGFGTPVPDYKGSCFVFNTAGTSTTTTQSFRIASFTSSTGTQLLNVLLKSFGSNAYYYVPGMYMDYTSGRLFYIMTGYPSPTNGYIQEIAPSTLGAAGVIATFGTITGGSGYVSGTYTGVTLTLSSGPAPSTFPVVNITVTGGIVTAVGLLRGGIGSTSTTVFTVPNTQLGGSGSGFSIPVNTIRNAGTDNLFQVSLSASTAYTYSYMYSGDTSFRGDLSLIPYRGMLNISSKKPGTTIGYISRVVLSLPASDAVNSSVSPAGNTYSTSGLEDATRNSNCTQIPAGWSAGMSTNGQSIISTLWISSTDNRIYYTKDLFQMNNVTGGNTGRLLLKA
jgi:hypothetical protein